VQCEVMWGGGVGCAGRGEFQRKPRSRNMRMRNQSQIFSGTKQRIEKSQTMKQINDFRNNQTK
jgi:hypothetical protein